ncbi:hypothetical protein Salat_2997400 [Sesamum alatum]|uniref:Uncharacterized protein n=1 Tax=Sesamum alatum TaxID=300844 RepID=A0AAE2C7J3_9LAMI|nr:hypothetical protein Salat_2997400 [Sesamum alatum]
MLSKPIHLSETEESGISCVGVKSGDLRRNAKSEGSSLGPYRRWGAKAWGANRIRYPGDDDVELTAEKDSAFRRSARWCVIYWRKVGMTSSPHGPYGLGHTRATMAITMGSKAVRRSESGKIASVRIVLCNSGT